MKVCIFLQGGHSVEIDTARTWSASHGPLTPSSAIAMIRTAIAQSSPLEDTYGGTVVIERPDSVVGYAVAR